MKILLHLPHSSLKVPKRFYKGLLISKQEFLKYNYKMTDLFTDKLFEGIKGKVIKAKYSRLYCDVERFCDDSKEIMAKYGQGVIYTNTYDGKLFHYNSEKYKEKVMKYYYNHHKKLDKTAKKLIKKDNLLIIDCHSFSEEMAKKLSEGPFPDICIGIEENYYDQEIVDNIINKIKDLGLSYRINYPYKGSLVPNAIYNGKLKGNVVSIMIEINKKLYI